MRLHNLVIEAISPLPEDINVSAVICLAFDEEGKLLVVKNKRGWDLPGGHVEEGESLLEALSREVMEEACATISSPEIFLTATGTRTMVFYTARIKELLPFDPKDETTERLIVSPDKFKEIYEGGMPELLDYAIMAASLRSGI